MTVEKLMTSSLPESVDRWGDGKSRYERMQAEKNDKNWQKDFREKRGDKKKK